MLKMIESIYGVPDYVTGERRIDEVFEGGIVFDILVEDNLIVCLANEESFTDEPMELTYDDVVKICEQLIDDSYKRQIFVFYEILPEEEERDRLRRWARERGVEIIDTIEFVCWYYMKRSEFNDNFAEDSPEEWRETLAAIFPDFVH